MRKTRLFGLASAAVAALGLTACSWVQEPIPGKQMMADYFVDGNACELNVNAAYAPLGWEFNATYYSEWFIGDVMSDDALKGGENISDMAMVYDMENFKANSDNQLLLDYYRSQYMGISRCNLSLTLIPEVETTAEFTQSWKDRLIGELYFVRAYYYFRLIRVFGPVPLTTEPMTDQSKWQMQRADVSEIYAQIQSDLEKAEALLWSKSETKGANTGRATQGAAQAMLCKINLYQGNWEEAKKWGEKLIASGQYQLNSDYAKNFTLAGENDQESVFEIQYVNDPTSAYGDGGNSRGSTRGTFTTILTRSRAQIGNEEGWGFDKPSQNLYDEFEDGDARRDATILLPPPALQKENDNYMGVCRYLNRKTGLYNEAGNGVTYNLQHHTRGDLNKKEIRYADVLLMVAEAYSELGNSAKAEEYLEMVRARARAYAINKGADASVLPAYPGYQILENGLGSLITPDLKQAIRHERRVELAMESHRWFDLVRWGIAGKVMNAYRDACIAAEDPSVVDHMNAFIEGKHEYFPIPSKEIELNPMEQNFGY